MTTLITETIARHAISVYHEMERNSTEEGEYKVWRGSLTGVFNELNISRTHYTLIWRILEDGGFISKLTRGGGGRATAVALHFPPEASSLTLTDASLPATLPLVQRIESLEKQTGGINIVEALMQMQGEIDKIKSIRTTTQGE